MQSSFSSRDGEPPAVKPSASGSSVWRRALLFSAGIWGLVAAVLTMAMYAASLRSGGTPALTQLLLTSVLPFAPMFVYTLLGSVVMEGRGEQWLRAHRLLWLFPLQVAVLLPVLLVWEGLLDIWTHARSIAELPGFFQQLNPVYYWTDFILVCSAVAFQTALLSWRTSHQRSLALEAARRENTELRLELLQGQLEPHFLFNALNTISSLVRGADRATATTALARLSDLLRYALRASQNPWLSVQDEIDFVQHYLSLQGLRFSDRLQIQWRIEAQSWGTIACPPLLLQPLIENAVRHGLESHDEHCAILVSVSLAGERVVFCIDNPLAPAGKTAPGHGLGLPGTRDRLALLYGERAELSARVHHDIFRACIRLPVEELP